MHYARSAARALVPALLAGFMVTSCVPYGLYGDGTTPLTPPDAPNVEVASVRIADFPEPRTLATFVCAEYLGPLICQLIGPMTNPEDATFAFDLEMKLANENPIPLPLASALVAFTVYPGAAEERLGDLCLTFCADDTSCVQSADNCRDDRPEIRDWDDFAMATANFLIGIAVGEHTIRDLRVQMIPAGGELRMVVRMRLDPRQMITIITRVSRDLVNDLRARRIPSFEIPFRVEGSVWVDVENFGRIAAGFGPREGNWRPGQRLEGLADRIGGGSADGSAGTTSGGTGAATGGSTGATSGGENPGDSTASGSSGGMVHHSSGTSSAPAGGTSSGTSGGESTGGGTSGGSTSGSSSGSAGSGSTRPARPAD